MLKCAANNYRMAFNAAQENCHPDVINRLLESARFYDAQAQK